MLQVTRLLVRLRRFAPRETRGQRDKKKESLGAGQKRRMSEYKELWMTVVAPTVLLTHVKLRSTCVDLFSCYCQPHLILLRAGFHHFDLPTHSNDQPLTSL